MQVFGIGRIISEFFKYTLAFPYITRTKECGPILHENETIDLDNVVDQVLNKRHFVFTTNNFQS